MTHRLVGAQRLFGRHIRRARRLAPIRPWLPLDIRVFALPLVHLVGHVPPTGSRQPQLDGHR